MATSEQTQAQLDELDEQIASGVTSVTTSDGKSVGLDDAEGLAERRRMLLARHRRHGPVRVAYARLKDAG